MEIKWKKNDLCSPDWKVSQWHQYLIFSKIIHLLVQMSSREEIKHAGRASKRPGVDRQAVGRNTDLNYGQGFWLQDMQVAETPGRGRQCRDKDDVTDNYTPGLNGSTKDGSAEKWLRVGEREATCRADSDLDTNRVINTTLHEVRKQVFVFGLVRKILNVKKDRACGRSTRGCRAALNCRHA